MRVWLKRHFPSINRAVGSIADWATVIGLFGFAGVSALMTWAASSVSFIAQYGWGAIVFAGLGIACILSLVMSAGLVAWRYFHPLPIYETTTIQRDDTRSREDLATYASASVKRLDSASLYVADIRVDVQHLQTDLYAEVAIRGFNGTGKSISLKTIRGTISAETRLIQDGPIRHIGKLPTPSLLENRTQTRAIPVQAEIFFVLEQRIPRALVDTILAALDAGGEIQLGLNDLDVIISDDEDASREIRLKLWNGVTLKRWPEWIVVGRIIELQGHIRL